MRAVGVRIGHPLFRPWLSGIGGEAADPRESANPREFAAVAATTQLTNQHRQFEGICLAPHPGHVSNLRKSTCGLIELFNS